jgi:hypothetical protein
MRRGKFGRRPPLLLLLLLRPRDRLGLGPCLILISLEFTGSGGPVFENICVPLAEVARQTNDGHFPGYLSDHRVEPSEVFDERRTPTLVGRSQNTMKFHFFGKSAL